MIRWIIFDLADTSIKGLTGVEEELFAAGLSAPQERIVASLREEMSDFLLGRQTEDEYLLSVIRKHEWNIGREVLKQTIRRHFEAVIPGMPEIVKRLSEKYDLALISNHGREWIAQMDDVFHHVHNNLRPRSN